MNTNDLVYRMAERAKVLADLPIDELRSEAGYGCDTRAEAIRKAKDEGSTRGHLVETVLTEEFVEEFPREIMED